MPKTIALLMRHGDYHQLPSTPSALQPFPLTEEGVKQAECAVKKITKYLEEFGCELDPTIHSSQLLRAWQTAALLKEGLETHLTTKLAIESFNELAERSVGALANLSKQQIEEVVQQDPRLSPLPSDWKTDSFYRLPFTGAESLIEAGERVARHLAFTMEKTMQNASGNRIKIFVGHGASIRHAAYHLGILSFEQIAQLSMFHADPLLLEYLPSGDWHHLAGEWKVRDREALD